MFRARPRPLPETNSKALYGLSVIVVLVILTWASMALS
ncbi:hypothetical protein STENM223S_09786 [Streptomyces tendae]